MSEQIITEETVPCFESVPALQDGLASKRAFGAIDLYPRDGSVQLCELEERVGRLNGIHGHEVVLFGSGMTAVASAIEVGLNEKSDGSNQLSAVFGNQLYSQTRNYQSYLRNRGVSVKEFDSGSPDSLKAILKNNQPDLIFCETVSNGPDMPVLDIVELKEELKEAENQPVVVLDNTLPLTTGLDLSDKFDKDDEIIVVESGTKSYTFNNELLGIAYSKNPGYVDALRQYRRTVGAMPGKGDMDTIGALLPETREAFDSRNLRLMRNTGELALRLYEETNGRADFIVTHPSLETHDNHRLASEVFPEGNSPLLYLQCIGESDQFDLADRLWSHEGVRENAKLGQSFGFDEARILPDEIARTVRISPGAYTDVEALGDALIEASSR